MGLLRIIRETEEATRSLSIDDLVRRTGLSHHMVTSRIDDLRELAYAAESLPPHLHDFILINREVDWTRPLDDGLVDDDDGDGDDERIGLVVADRADYWRGIADDRSTLTSVGLARVGLFAYSIDETLDRLTLLVEHGLAVDDDGERFYLQEAYWKLRGWLKTISPSNAGRFPAVLE